MPKRMCVALMAMLMLLCTACAPPASDRYADLPPTMPPVLTPDAAMTPTPTPISTTPEYVADPNKLDSAPSQWPLFARYVWIDYSSDMHAYIEKEMDAQRITTSTFEYTFYLAKNCRFLERDNGVGISYAGSNPTMLDYVGGMDIVAFAAGTDIEAKFREALPGRANEFDYIDETPADPAFSRIYHGKPIPGYIERAVAWYVLANANPNGTRTVVAQITYPYEHPILAGNMLWMAKSFRMP